MPIDAVVAVTYRCNSRCIMCDIWQIKDFPEMPAQAFAKLPATLKDVNISGGEPFLRTDLVEIVRVIKKACPKANLNISTNGFLVETIKQVLPEIKRVDPNIAISVSIDGVGQMHEKVRRVQGAWPKVVETVRFCREVAKIKYVKFAFTLNDINLEQLQTAYEWSKRLGTEFTMAVAHSSANFFGGTKEKFHFFDDRVKKQFEHIIKELLKSMRPKDWARAYFVDGLYRITKGGKRPLESYAGEDFFYLDPKGDIYPSVIDDAIMGNINDGSNFDELWYSQQAQEARDAIRGFESNYWMVCTARSAMKRNPLKVANWIFKNKLKWTA